MKRAESKLGIFGIAICLSLAFLLPASSNARAENGDITVALQGAFGFEGGYETDVKWPSGFPDFDPDGDFITTFGIDSYLDYRLSSYFSLGVDVRALWFNSESGDKAGTDRSTWAEIGPSVKLGAEAFQGGEVFLRLTPGLTIALYAEDSEGKETSTGVGFNISGFVGFKYEVLNGFGVSIELGMIFHQVYQDNNYRITVGGEILEGQVDSVMDGFQFHLNSGVYLNL